MFDGNMFDGWMKERERETTRGRRRKKKKGFSSVGLNKQ